MGKTFLLWLSLLWASLATGGALWAGPVFVVDLDTQAFAGQQGAIGLLAFDLIGGDAQPGNNTVRAFGFQTDGILADSSGVTLNDTAFFNEELRPITFGTFLKFKLSLTANRLPPGVDEFSFLVLDSAGLQPLVHTSDPTGADVLFAGDVDGTPGGALTVYNSLTENFSWTVTSVNNVPDSGSWQLPLSALLWLALWQPVLRRSREA